MQMALPTAIVRTLAAYFIFAGQGTVASSGLESYLAAHPISTITLASISPVQSPSIESVQAGVKKPSATSNTARVRCPASCNESKPNNWTVYHDVDRLALCNRTMLLDFNLYNQLKDPRTHESIRSCTADFESSLGAPGGLINRPCRPSKNLMQAEATLQMAWIGSSSATATGDVAAAAQQMERYIRQGEVGCNETVAFAYSGQAALGLYAGSGIQSQGIATAVLEQFGAYVEANGVSESLLVQLCATNGRSSRFAFGIIVNTNANLSSVQHTIKTWRDGKCITEYDKAAAWQNVTFMAPTVPTHTNSTSTAVQVTRELRPRATCTTIVAHGGDSCESLAVDCGITPAQFTVYNPSTALCSAEGQHFCCTSGTLPDFAPKPNSDGTCHSYFVDKGNTCSQLAAQYSLTVTKLETFNENTWGWMGCADLQAGNNICLSTGSPPMPAPIVNAVCGPQVPGTPTPPAGTDLSNLNGCVLNACCDIWGQCGTTDEFCTASKGPAGAPGTAAVGSSGCISNCGTPIIIGAAPVVFRKIGYFEAFDSSRACLNKPVTSFDTTGYTHIHLAFATITPDWDVDVSSIHGQFIDFIHMTGFKRILSFGGWTFSTDPSTYFLFREAMEAAHRDTLVANVVAFVKQYNLDGVDFDWEYPAEPDIRGIPPGSAVESLNYFLFLNDLRNSLPAGTSVSIAAPASFWYLKNFAIAAIGLVVDYIIFMTYDLHGQWDYDHPYSDTGCPGGDCLRSHVNLTETISALSMITKAGVPSNKVVVGVTSYGRSFQMTTAGCTGEDCTYTGPLSGAYGGPCTQTPGYIANAEIAGIIARNGTVVAADGTILEVTGSIQSFQDDSFSNIVVYDETQWIAYMDDDNKATRTAVYAAYNLGGTTDWAVDLQTFDGDVTSDSTGGSVVYVDPSIWTSDDHSITCEPPCVIVLPPYPLGITSTIVWPTLTTTLMSSSAGSTYTVTTTISVPAFPISEIDFQPITLGPTDTSTYEIMPVQSIMPPSFIFTLPPFEAIFLPTPISTKGGQATATTTSSGSVVPILLPPVVFHTTPVPIIIQPQPTEHISFPPQPKPIPHVTVSKGSPKPQCKYGCGHRNCGLFGCGGGSHCGLFGCGGGCGIFGCGGGCGIFGCSPDCPLNFCGGPGCTGGRCGYGSNGDHGDSDQNEDCDEPKTASACTYIISSWSTSPMTKYSTTTRTNCETTVDCTAEDTKTTTTETTSASEETGFALQTLYETVDSSTPDYLAIASSIISDRSVWDATRFASMTAPATITHTPTTPTTTGDSQSPDPSPTAALYIELEVDSADGSFEGQLGGAWNIYTPPVNAGPPGPPSFNACYDRIGFIGIDMRNVDYHNVPAPDGTLKFTFDILGTSGCSYTGTSGAAGTLSCPDLVKPVQCITDESDVVLICALKTKRIFTSVYCAWD